MKTVFVVGNKRSGTSLLVRLLNAHPGVYVSHESDILCRRIVDNMAARYPKQFEAHYVLSKPPDNWVLTGKGSSGRVNLSILRQHGFAFEDPGDASDPGAIGLTCGSDAFNEHAAFANLLQMGYPRDRMFAF